MKTKFTKNPFYEEVLHEMKVAGDQAGDQWLKEHTKPAFIVTESKLFSNEPGKVVGGMLDLCGFASIRIADKRKSFPKYFISKLKTESGYGCASSLMIRYKHNRQEMGLNESMMEASWKVLKHYSLTDGLYPHSYID